MNRDDSTTRLLKAGSATALTLLVGLVVAPVLSRWHNHRLIDRLSAEISTADDTEIKVPLRKLAKLGPSAVESLVVAAASERATVATVARQIIDEKLTAWESAGASGSQASKTDEFQDSVTTLATALGSHIHQFGLGGKQWSERVTLRLIEFSPHLPGRHTRVLLDECSKILAAIPPRGPKFRTISAQSVFSDASHRFGARSPQPKLESLTRTSEGSLQQFARVQPKTSVDNQGQLTKVLTQPKTETHKSNRYPAPTLEWSQQSLKGKNQAAKGTSMPMSKTPRRAEIINPAASLAKQVVDVPTPQETAARASEIERFSTQALFDLFQTATHYESAIIRAELRERGYPDEELAILQRVASSELEDRLRLVEDVSRIPATTARRVLQQLLSDQHPDVRLRALTALATTNSPNLKELAHKLAMHDDDPRVVELASRLLRRTR